MKHGYKVKIDTRCDYYERSDEEYGPWHGSYSNYFKGVTKSDLSVDVVSDIDIKPGEICYLVWIEYSSGDSFGIGDRECTEVIGIFKDEQSAKELAKSIEEHDNDDENRTWDEKYGFYCKTSDGQEFKYGCAPWTGYFETLEEVHIETVVMGGEN